MHKWYITLLFLCGLTYGFSQGNDEILAENYFKNSAFKKALVIYKTLHQNKPYALKYVFKLAEIHQQLENYSAAETILQQRLQLRENPLVHIELGYNYQLINVTEKADYHYNKALNYIDKNPNYAYTIGKKFEDKTLLDKALLAYKMGEKANPKNNFTIQMARIYGDKGEVGLMLNSYLDYIYFRPGYLNIVKRTLASFISEDAQQENNKLLKTNILKRIQNQPDPMWYDMLSWLYVQERAYSKSFIQEKALYKRNPESLNRILDLGTTALKDNDTETATRIFDYVLKTTQSKALQLTAHQYILDIETKAASEKELQTINTKYLRILSHYGKTPETFQLQLAYGTFLAFYINDTTQATKFLKALLQLNITKFQNAEVKMVLADILVLEERFNEALIYYSQIQVNLKNSTIAQEARFKVAKTSYYKGDFEWAESQLNILKSSTTQRMANDALDLKLLISDNTFEDSLQVALKLYAKADLLAYQNKITDAITTLNTVLKNHNGESITDQALFKQAQLFEKQSNYQAAEQNYLQIINNYQYDILIDDALFYLAKLYNSHLGNPKKAKTYLEQLIFNHQDSIYFVDARQLFRQLRGDTVY